MLALHRARLRPQTLRVVRPTRSPHLSNRRFLFQSVCDGFLDLALALPVPPSLPTYSTAIILVTVVTRCAFLPISIWVRCLYHIFFVYFNADWNREGTVRVE